MASDHAYKSMSSANSGSTPLTEVETVNLCALRVSATVPHTQGNVDVQLNILWGFHDIIVWYVCLEYLHH